MKVVLDTNVLVLALLNPNFVPAQVLNLILNGKIALLYDNRILDEYREVLFRKKFGFPKEWVKPLLDFIEAEGEYVIADPIYETFTDDDDRVFYETAVSGGASYLITGNRAHFPKKRLVCTPAEFLRNYRKMMEVRE